MDVTLYCYDLSRGLARQFSRSFLGTYIEAVWHTSLVFGNIEYFFGAGVQTCIPGTTHHGQPMQRIPLGQTQLPLDVILEYLESLKTIYTAESYDLFLHNCNNFSNDFATFLVGKGIPEHITSLPQTVLSTPFGQMLKPQLDQALRGITQAPVAPPPQAATTVATNGGLEMKSFVHTPTTMAALLPLLEQARNSCAVLFFTSATCPPCKICYGPYEDLAAEFSEKATLVKVDISQAQEVGAHYSIRATPTFVTFLKGEQLDQWSGADVAKLRSNVQLLVQMAHPPHPHCQLQLPTLQKTYRPSVYSKMPPLDKVLAKVDASIRTKPEVEALKQFISARSGTPTVASVALPDLAKIGKLLQEEIPKQLPLQAFPLVDLFRLALLDVRVSGYFAEERQLISLHRTLITYGAGLKTDASTYPLLLTIVQALSNAFTSPLSFSCIISIPDLHRLLSDALLAGSHPALRAAAANLVFNIASAHHKQIISAQTERVDTDMQDATLVEVVVSVLEALNQELGRTEQIEKETVKGLTLAVGLLVYLSSEDTLAELQDVFTAIGARSTIEKTRTVEGISDIAKDVLQILP